MAGIKISQMEEKSNIDGTEYIPIVDGSDNKRVKTDKLLTKTIADSTYQEKGSYLTEVPEGYVTDTELEEKGYLTSVLAQEIYQPVGEYIDENQLSSKQDILVSGTNIKTINGESILGSGDLTINSGIPEAPKDGKFYCRKDGEWVEIPTNTGSV